MTNFQKAVAAMHYAAEQYGVSVVALLLEDEEEAIVATSSAKSLLFAQELIGTSVDNIPKEMLKEECECNNCKPKENHFLSLLNNSFPKVYETMPEDVKESFKKLFHGKSEKIQEELFEKTFDILKSMNKIIF